MTQESTPPAKSTSPDHSVGRRRFLSVLGARAVGGLAGCTSASGTDPTPTSTSTPSESDAIDPQFGFVGTSPEVSPPIEPDHEVKLLIGEREGAPIPEFYFDPVGLYVESDAVVKFTLATPDHTVTGYHPSLGRTQRVPDGVPALSSPVLGGGAYWLYRFETPGVYDLNCAPHEQFGMAMRVVVGEATGPGSEPVSTEAPAHGEPRPPAGTAATVLSDEALAPGTVVERGQVAWADLDPESKQLQL